MSNHFAGLKLGPSLEDERLDLFAVDPKEASGSISKGEIPPDGLTPHTDLLKKFPYLGTPHPSPAPKTEWVELSVFGEGMSRSGGVQ